MQTRAKGAPRRAFTDSYREANGLTQADSYEVAALLELERLRKDDCENQSLRVAIAQVYATLELAKYTRMIYERGR